MKKRIIYSLAALLMTGAMSSCSNEENMAEERIDADKAEITIDTEAYQSDQDVTRAAWNRQTETVDLGDGLTADVSIEADKQDDAAQTRASMSNEHYTIYALDGSSTRVATMTGTVTGGNKFTRDASSPRMILAPGTYTFVCINDAVTDNGTSLTVSNGTANPMIGTTTQTISGPGWQISFAMKHQTARVRLKVTSYTNEGTGLTASLSTTTAQPATAAYNVDGTANTAANTTATLSSSYTIPATHGSIPWSSIVQSYENVIDYQYFLPGITGSDITLTFDAGTIYGKTLAGKTLSLSNLGTLTRNGSYTVNIKLKTFPYYLFQDGTVGALGDKGSRTPIGIVITEKTTTEQGLAIALKDAGSGLSWGPDHVKANDVQIGQQLGVGGIVQNAAFMTDMNGYHYTWEASGSDDGTTIKGNVNTFPVFYAAAQYNPGVAVTGANVGKWFLPAAGQWRLFYLNVGKYDWPVTQRSSNSGSDVTPFFTQAGGTAISYGSATSTETTDLTHATQAWNFGSGSAALSDYFERTRSGNEWHVRSFVHF